jgi:hypothetical protein
MSRMFNSREEAFHQGFQYACRYDLCKYSLEDINKSIQAGGEICLSSRLISSLWGDTIPDQVVISFKNLDGEVVDIGSTKFRDGYDLWLLGPNFCTRV